MYVRYAYFEIKKKSFVFLFLLVHILFCGVYPEYLHCAGPEAMRLLVELFAQVWESEIVPDDWCQGIIVPI